MQSTKRLVTSCLLVLLATGTSMAGVRLKDIATLQGTRGTQLYGFGLVIGLNNTGGKSLFTQQVATDMLQRMVGPKTGLDVQSDNLFKSANISAVMVTAEIGPFCRRGSRIDVTVSILDDASSLLNGELLLTPLRGADGVVYAVAQGSVKEGDDAKDKATSEKNTPVTVGRVVGGATIESEVRSTKKCPAQIRMVLRHPDETTAKAVARGVNALLPGQARVLDKGTIVVEVPVRFWADPIAFLNHLGNLALDGTFETSVGHASPDMRKVTPPTVASRSVSASSVVTPPASR